MKSTGAGRARKNFLRCRRQMAKMVREVASQGMDEERRNSAAWDECKNTIEALQKDMRGFSDAQAKMEHKIASFVTGLQEVTEGLAEVRTHMLGQFWNSVQGMRGAGGLPLATTGAALHPTTSDVEMIPGDVEGLYGVSTWLDLLEEARDVWEDAMQTEAARRGELAGNVYRLQMELGALPVIEARRCEGAAACLGWDTECDQGCGQRGSAFGCCRWNEGGYAAGNEEGAGN